MRPASEVIWRNRHRLGTDPRLLLVGASSDDLGTRLAREGFVPQAACLSFAAHRYLSSAGVPSTFGLEPSEPGAWPRIILFQPREKALLEMLLDWCASRLAADGELWLVGENRAGIKSAGRRLAEYFSHHHKIDSARHCALFEASSAVERAEFSLLPYFQGWTFESAGKRISIRSLPGVFAHGRLDRGTELLLDSLGTRVPDLQPTGRVLDFACGSGVVGIGLASTIPGLHLTLLDDSWLALESTRRSLDANGLEARLLASDGLSELAADERFDWIVSNPPFHSGVHDDAALARRLLSESPAHLAAGGRLCLVANRHLPSRAWLSELFGVVQVLAADREYNVWLATAHPP